MEKVNKNCNFCRVFELPQSYSSEYCFGGGIDTNFKMVDWFNPLSTSYEDLTWKENKKRIIDFIKEKNYIKNNRSYLIITNFGKAIIFKMDGGKHE